MSGGDVSQHRPADADRYSRQTLLPGVGVKGQARLADSTAVVVGCGALGSVSAPLLVRAGVGRVRLIDRDWVEVSNLQRQALFTQADAEARTPKAVAAAAACRAYNPEVEVEHHVADVMPGNVLSLLADADVIVDGLDNFETRYLLNDAAHRLGIPYVYGGALRHTGMVWPIVPPGQDLLDLFPEPPAAGSTPTCESAGVWGPTTHMVASLQTSEALKLLTGDQASVSPGLFRFDLRAGEHTLIRVPTKADRPPRRHFPFLDAPTQPAVRLCGGGAVHLQLGRSLDPSALVEAWRGHPSLKIETVNPHLARVRCDAEHTLTLFRDGRVVVHGTTEPAEARSLVDRWIGR